MSDGTQKKPTKPREKSLGEQATGTDASRARKPRTVGEQSTNGDPESSTPEPPNGPDHFANSNLPFIDMAARYQIERELGKGGMGAVQLATDLSLQRKVAIKRIVPRLVRSKNALQRFVAEAQSIAALSHFNIVHVHEFGRDADGPLLVLEYVSGGSLLDKLKEGKLELEEAVKITCQLCDGLAVAHEQGIIHRDIKPANILLTSRGEPKLTDFGLVRQQSADRGQTQSGTVLGTLDYMSPEQRRDATAVDARSDLWSLAATCYQMITGSSPRVIRLDRLPPNLAPVIGQMLEEEPEKRYASAEEFKTELENGLAAVTGKTVVKMTAGVCPACGAVNDVSRRFCRGCRGSLMEPCISCETDNPVWEDVCGECGTSQQEQRESERQQYLKQARTAFEAHRYQDAIEWLVEIHDSLKDGAVEDLKQQAESQINIFTKRVIGEKKRAKKEQKKIQSLRLPEQLEQAIRLTAEMTEIEIEHWQDTELTQYAEWAVSHLEELTSQRKRLESERQRFLDQARKAFEAHQYQEVIELLGRIDDSFQDAPVEDLKQRAQKEIKESKSREEAEKKEAKTKEEADKKAAEAKQEIERPIIEKTFQEAREMFGRGLNSRQAMEKVVDQQLEMWRNCAEAGILEAQWLIGDCYLEGLGVDYDPTEAVRWFTKAADAGLPEAQVTLSNCYFTGTGTTKDESRGYALLQCGVDQGSGNALARLAGRIISRSGVDQSAEAAVEYCQQATEKESPGGTYLFAHCLQKGLGVEKDLVRARTLLEKAAELGYVRAQFDLAEALLADDSIAGAKDKAVEWLNRAAAFNYPPAMTRLETLNLPSPREITINSVGMELIVVPAGCFQMGEKHWQKRLASFRDENPQHGVCLTDDFYMCRGPVTQRAFLEVMGHNPSKFKSRLKGSRDNHPVEMVSWYDAVEFCNALSKLEGLSPYYEIKQAAHGTPFSDRIKRRRRNKNDKANEVHVAGGLGYRLPSEAEWEYAARSGQSTLWWFGNQKSEVKDYVWCKTGPAKETTHEVGQKHPNWFGLSDMLGNVWEWSWDWYQEDYYQNSPPIAPTGPEEGDGRVVRGGSWHTIPLNTRSAIRTCNKPEEKFDDLGFRVVRTCAESPGR